MSAWAPLVAVLLAGVAVAIWPLSGRQAARAGPLVVSALGTRPGSGTRWEPGKQTPREPPDAPLRDVAATCDLVALALQSGVSVDSALTAVADCSEPHVAAALRAVIAARRWGIEAADAGAGGRSWAPLVRALDLADHAGVPPAGSMRAAAKDQRRRRRHRLEVATARLRVLVVLPLGLCFLPAFVLTTIVPVVLALAAGFAAP